MERVDLIRETARGLVTSDPELGGKPVFKDTRLPVATLFEYLADGLTIDYFLESFPSISKANATAVVNYGLERIENELVA